MFKLFSRYVSVGVVNTIIHWLAFLIIYATGTSQAISNMMAFSVAVTFSFFANARFTFNRPPTTRKYMIYIVFMGGIAGGTGKLSDFMQLPSVITLVLFSALSLVIGFIYSRYIVFKDMK